MDYRHSNSRVPRSTQMTGTTSTPPRAHPLRNVTNVDRENEANEYAYYTSAYGGGYPRSLQMSPSQYPQLGGEPGEHLSSSFFYPTVYTELNVPRFMGPQDISPTKHEEAMLHFQQQRDTEANANLSFDEYNPRDASNFHENKGPSPTKPRALRNGYRGGNLETLEEVPDHIDQTQTSLGSVAELSSQYGGQSLANTHAHVLFDDMTNQQTLHNGSNITPSKSKANASNQMTDTLAKEHQVGRFNATGDNAVDYKTTSTVMGNSSKGLPDPFVTEQETLVPFFAVPQPDHRMGPVTQRHHSRFNFEPRLPKEYYPDLYDQGQNYGIAGTANNQNYQMVQAKMPSGTWDVPIMMNQPQVPQTRAAAYPPQERITPVPWPVTPSDPTFDARRDATTRVRRFRDKPEFVNPFVPSWQPPHGLPGPKSNASIFETLNWFHTDNRGEPHLREQIYAIADEDRERRHREKLEKGERPEVNLQAEASNYILGDVLVNLQTYLVGDRAAQAGNFANWAPDNTTETGIEDDASSSFDRLSLNDPAKVEDSVDAEKGK